MQEKGFDRSRLEFFPLGSRKNKLLADQVMLGPASPVPDPGPAAGIIERTAERIVEARRRGAPVVICHGAHLVRNGLGPVLSDMVRQGWLQHVATNGAGSIHDWEFAFLGSTCEDVKYYASRGQFGMWEETGTNLGLALLAGALDGAGYGESVGRMIVEEEIEIPSQRELGAILEGGLAGGAGRPGPGDGRAGARHAWSLAGAVLDWSLD